LQHLTIALQILKDNSLFVKLSKCQFAVPQIEYLGHVISSAGVATDPSKIAAMVNWPQPSTVKQLRGFLGLTGYYRKFIQCYGLISKPLFDLLKKDSFKWTLDSQKAFESLKHAMVTAPVLTLPDFSKPFVIETDASQLGIGAVLMQDRRPLAFMSKKLGPKNQGLSTYEKELLALITAVTKWKHYLIGYPFIIRTDQISLKHLLEQKIHTALQHRGLSKLLGLDYTIEYKRGVDNVVADALSRRDNSSSAPVLAELQIISEIIPQWVQDIKLSYTDDPWIADLLQKLHPVASSENHLTLHQGIIRFKGRICVGNSGNWRLQLLKEIHDSSAGGHSGSTGTYHRMKRLFYWPNLKQAVLDYVKTCPTCQMTKPEHIHTPGLLQPLPIPSEAWSSVGIDFITGLPKSEGKEVIFVVVDRLTKYAHFIALSHPYSALTVAQAFLDNVYKLHGLPSSIISDRDPVFTSNFWKQLTSLLGITLNLSTAYHPQTDGQTERVNQCLETYLRSMLLHQPKRWTRWLPLAQWWYNSNFHSSLQTSPFQALYGYPPPSITLGHPPRSNIEAVNILLHDRHRALTQLKANLLRAQDRMKKFADQNRTERSFKIGDWVYLRFQPYRQISVSNSKNTKLNPRFYGPFEIEDRVGSVAYRLRLPVGSAIHPVLHVSQLKQHLSRGQVVSPQLPLLSPEGQLQLYPAQILERRAIKRNNVAVPQILVSWTNLPAEDASWEDYDDIAVRFPQFILEDKNRFEGGRVSDIGTDRDGEERRIDTLNSSEELVSKAAANGQLFN
jgi:transposase InsO family protein